MDSPCVSWHSAVQQVLTRWTEVLQSLSSSQMVSWSWKLEGKGCFFLAIREKSHILLIWHLQLRGKDEKLPPLCFPLGKLEKIWKVKWIPICCDDQQMVQGRCCRLWYIRPGRLSVMGQVVIHRTMQYAALGGSSHPSRGSHALWFMALLKQTHWSCKSCRS